jgi:hypothetical protein
MLAAGFLTPVASTLLSSVMFTAIRKVHAEVTEPAEEPEPVSGDSTGDGQPVRERVPVAA